MPVILSSVFKVVACLIATVAAVPAWAWYAGVGYSTVTDGRKIPAVVAGVDIDSGWMLTGMAAGVRTKAYATSGYTLCGLKRLDWGEFWQGRLITGFGAGAYYGRKVLYTQVDDDSGQLTEPKVDTDTTLGPAFRVAWTLGIGLYLGVEFAMGLRPSALENGWPNAGIGSIGWEY